MGALMAETEVPQRVMASREFLPHSRHLSLWWSGPAGPALLWLLAVVLALLGLGSQPLRDWDEGIVARVALELSRSSWPSTLLPTYWGDPYLNKPPGLHWIISMCITLWRS